jgi:amino acid permease
MLQYIFVLWLQIRFDLLIFTESLKFSSAISTLLAIAFVTICSVLAIIALVEGKTQTPRLIPRLDHETTFFDLFTAVPVIVTAYTFHFNGKNFISYFPNSY